MAIVGGGDFSYSLSLAKAFGSDTNITAISLVTPAKARRNSNSGKANVIELERLGCTVVHGVNVDSMASDLQLDRYNRIILDYSHSWLGFACESDFYYLMVHNDVFRGFLENASKMLKDKKGQIHVTHNTSGPYPRSELDGASEELGLRVIWQNESINKVAGSTSNSSYPIAKAITFKAL